MRTYLPEIGVSDLIQALTSRDWSSVQEILDTQMYERLGIDRALAIASDLLARHRSLDGLRVLDVGSNNGLVAKTLTALGCSLVGIDNGDVDDQGIYTDLLRQSRAGGFEYHRKDLADFFSDDKRCWDCILLLSVTHHWESGYAMSGKRRYTDDDIRKLMAELFRRTRLSIYYECPRDEPGFSPGFGVKFLFRYCAELPAVREVGCTTGPNGYLRELWALDVE